MKETLKDLGLNNKEIDIYLTLLPIGKAPASVVSYRTGISRSTAKYTCNQLVEKKLFLEIQEGNTSMYTPESPDKIMFLLEEEKRKLEEKENKASRIIGQLKAMVDPETILPKIEFGEGMEKVVNDYNKFFDLIPSNSTVYDYVNSFEDFRFPLDREKIIEACVKKRLEKNIHIKCISTYSKPGIKLKKNDKKCNRETLFADSVDDDAFEVLLYKDIVLEVVYTDRGVFSFITKHPQIVRMRRELFKMAWETAKKKDKEITKKFLKN